MKRDKAKRTPPSRKKYEQENPTVSCRVPKELYDGLKAAKDADGRSFTDILKLGLGILELKVSKEQEARGEGFEEGFGDGYEAAESLYKVTFPCSVCRKTIAVTDKTTKEAVKRYMVEHGWGHAECINQRR